MLTEILIAIAVALAGGLLYTIVGIIPGTDETATMVPITIILVLAGLPAGALFAWEIGIIVAMQVSHTIPTAMSALPGSTMAVPMVLNCSIAKRLGVPHMAMRKMASGSIVGTCFADPVPSGQHQCFLFRRDLHSVRTADRMDVLRQVGRCCMHYPLRHLHSGSAAYCH